MILTPSVTARLCLHAALASLAILPATAFAQDSQTPPATLENFSLPPGQNQVQPAPPVVVPTIPPSQIPPAPTLTPSPSPTQATTLPARPPSVPPQTPARTPAQSQPQRPAPPSGETVAPVAAPDTPANEAVASPPTPPIETTQPAPTEPATAESATGASGWTGWIVAALALLAAAGGLLFWRRRRKTDQDFYEEVDQPLVADSPPEPLPAAPVVADPVALAERQAAPLDQVEADQSAPVVDAVMAEATPEDVAAATLPAGPEGDRPWLEFALRPVKAGVNVMDAVVEFELTVGNASAVPADDVRIAAWLISASPHQDAEIAHFLENTPPEAIMAPIAIAPGDGKRIDAAIALPRARVNVVTARNRPFFVPLVIVDARYALPGGGEGRSSAAMVIGTVREGQDKLGPIWLDRGVQMHTNVEARVHGEPRRS